MFCSQTTIGFGDRAIDEECPESIFLFIMQVRGVVSYLSQRNQSDIQLLISTFSQIQIKCTYFTLLIDFHKIIYYYNYLGY